MVTFHSDESCNSQPRGNVEVVAFSCNLSTIHGSGLGCGRTRTVNQEDNRRTKRLDAAAAVVAPCALRCMRCQDRFSFLPTTQVWFAVVPTRARPRPVPSDSAYLCPPPLPQVVLLSSASRGSADTKRSLSLLRYRRHILPRQPSILPREDIQSESLECGRGLSARRVRRPLVASG